MYIYTKIYIKCIELYHAEVCNTQAKKNQECIRTRWVALMIQLEQQQHGELGLDQKLSIKLK